MVSEETSAGNLVFQRWSVIRNLLAMHNNPLVIDQDILAAGEKNLSFFQKSFATFVGSIVTSLAVTPFEVIKIRLQAQQNIREHLTSPSPGSAGVDPHKSVYIYRNGLMEFLCESQQDKPPINSPHTKGSHYMPKSHDVFSRKVIYPSPRVEPVQATNLKGTFDAFSKIARFEGIRYLWSGLSPTLVVSIPLTMMYFPMYDKLKYSFGFNQWDKSTYYVAPIAGALCRATIVCLFNPLELYKTKLQSENISYSQLLEASRRTFSHHGFGFLYSGTVPSLMRDVPFSAIYWFLYEHLKMKMMELHEESRPNLWGTLVAGAVAGSVAAIITLPFDVVKTHRQVELGINGDHVRLSTWSTLKGLYRRSGIRGLYAGTVPRMAKVAPACAIMISIYEAFKTFFIKYNWQADMKKE